MPDILATTQPLNAPPTHILNDLYPETYQNVQTSNLQAFHLFGHLPSEIRLMIWALALPRQQRLIEIELTSSVSVVTHAEPCTTDQPASLADAKRYCLGFVTRHVSPSLLSVNREARHFALNTFSVSIPFVPDDELAARCLDGEGHFRFDPESDIIFSDSSYGFEMLFDFLKDAKAFDSKNRGVQNLALGNKSIYRATSEGVWHAVDPECRLLAKSALTSIKKVYFIDTVSLDPPDYIAPIPRCSEMMPLTSRQESFSLIRSDPRPVRGDIPMIYIAHDPFRSVQEWKSMEKTCGLHRSEDDPLPTFFYLLKRQQHAKIRSKSIESREDAMRYLREEDAQRRLNRHEVELEADGRNSIRDRDTSELDRQIPLSVVGFWLFEFDPAYVISTGADPIESSVVESWQHQRVITTTQYPKLGLFHLLRQNFV